MTSYQHIYIWLKCRQLWGVGQMGEREATKGKYANCRVCLEGGKKSGTQAHHYFLFSEIVRPLFYFFGTSSWGVLVC